jgi:hypothetical protein
MLVPLAGIASFFLLSLLTVRILKPRQPRSFFLSYALLLLVAAAYLYARLWPLDTIDNRIGLMSCLAIQMLMCLTMWNAFYSLLWGFSGGLMHDLYNEPELRHVDRLVNSYATVSAPSRPGAPGPAAVGLDRILARRLPNLESGGYLELRNDTLRLRPKGRVIAFGTLAAFKLFSLGMGGGVK